MTFSAESLNLFAQLVAAYRLPGDHPEFDQIAAAISVARKELDVARREVNEAPETPPDNES